MTGVQPTRASADRIRILHLITGLGVGGAEMMLSKLLGRIDRTRFDNIVYSMTEPGVIADAIRQAGVEVRTLGMKRGFPDPRAFFRLARGIREWRPTLLQTWMYHADLLGGITGKLVGHVPVVWNIRHSDLRIGADKRMTIRVAQLCASLSLRLPDRIVCCAESSRMVHAKLGYRSSRMVVIPNGFELDQYRPQPDARRLCEERLGIPANSEVVSLVARYHPQKDHATFLAAAKLLSNHPELYFVLCGDGIEKSNRELMGAIERNGLADKVILLGRRKPDEIALLMSRSILTTSASRGEGFPNVIGEAMACGTICVVTDVGDSAYIVGDCGVVVRPGSPEDLAAAWKSVIAMGNEARRAAGDAARRRIEENFRMETIVRRYEEMYADVARANG